MLDDMVLEGTRRMLAALPPTNRHSYCPCRLLCGSPSWSRAQTATRRLRQHCVTQWKTCCRRAEIHAPSSLVTYKANPVAAVWHALGAADSALAPGWFGDFLLTGEKVHRTISHAENALVRSGTCLALAAAWIST